MCLVCDIILFFNLFESWNFFILILLLCMGLREEIKCYGNFIFVKMLLEVLKIKDW